MSRQSEFFQMQGWQLRKITPALLQIQQVNSFTCSTCYQKVWCKSIK